MAFLGIDHIDVRVPSLAAVEAFYAELLRELGLTRMSYANVAHGGAAWTDGTPENHNAVEFYEENTGGRPPRFLGIIEEADAEPSRSRIAFAVAPETLGAWEALLARIGAVQIERNDEEWYPAVFFADPVGTRLEVCARRPPR